MKIPAIMVTCVMFACSLVLDAQQTTTPTETAFTARRDEAMKHNPSDRCSQLIKKVEQREISLDTSSQPQFTRSLLKTLSIPISSQLLVYSGTASQGNRVNPENPRAIYFNDETYVGVVPGGFVEMLGVDPQYGAVLYSFESLKAGDVPSPTRSSDCLRCHNSNGAPSMVTRSVTPFAEGGLHQGFKTAGDGHRTPLSLRFGGWHVTSAQPFGPSKEGLLSVRTSAGVRVTRIKTGERYDPKMHLAQTSDIVAHLVHEHQVGFVNRVADLVTYARDGRFSLAAKATPRPERLDSLTRDLVSYVLFSDEALLPPGGIAGDPAFLKDFSANRKLARNGKSLKDFDLKTRMFRHRCSYMIHTQQWREMPAAVKSRVYALMKAALTGQDAEFSYLPEEERKTIIQILRDTVPDLPADWN
jgi:hypothetical protein